MSATPRTATAMRSFCSSTSDSAASRICSPSRATCRCAAVPAAAAWARASRAASVACDFIASSVLPTLRARCAPILSSSSAMPFPPAGPPYPSRVPPFVLLRQVAYRANVACKGRFHAVPRAGLAAGAQPSGSVRPAPVQPEPLLGPGTHPVLDHRIDAGHRHPHIGGGVAAVRDGERWLDSEAEARAADTL